MSGGMDSTHDQTSYEAGYNAGVRATRLEWRARVEQLEKRLLAWVEAHPPADPREGPVVTVGFFLENYQPPPWTSFIRGDGFIDILASGRPGTVLAKVPEELGRALVGVANEFLWRGLAKTLEQASEKIDRVLGRNKR